jgi:hypothetical protein
MPPVNISALIWGLVFIAGGLLVLRALWSPWKGRAAGPATPLVLLWRTLILLAALTLCFGGVVHIIWAFPSGPQF